MAEEMRATIVYRIVAFLVILISLLLVSLSLAAFFQTWNICSVLGGMILLPLPLTLAISQYMAAFREHRTSAKISATILFVAAALLGLPSLDLLMEATFNGFDWVALEIILSLLPLASFSALAGWLNMRWLYRLPLDANSANSYRFTLRELLASVAVVCMVIGLAVAIGRNAAPQYAENVSIDEAPFDLPPNATDVSFCQGVRGTNAYEFATDEDSFRYWVESGIGSMEARNSGTSLVTISSPTRVMRYNALSSDLLGPDYATVNIGLVYSWSFEDRGVTAVYDSSQKRAYYFEHYH